ncbi:unnamed protein product [Schistocephalus solidus]|uniref:PX domain-containing protein n=1 Tax=Schistocephalus solidus TaxID=70667 RepID=A0A183TA74_SCHSO|nr:unnamed protein product [Schistocephalus solidus]
MCMCVDNEDRIGLELLSLGGSAAATASRAHGRTVGNVDGCAICVRCVVIAVDSAFVDAHVTDQANVVSECSALLMEPYCDEFPVIRVGYRTDGHLLKSWRLQAPIDKEIFRKTYGAFVRSHLEYAVQAWRPWFKKDYLQLERVQARVTKIVKNLSHLPYEARMVELNFFPLNHRQLRGDLIQTYRIVRGHERALEFADFFELAGTEHLRGHPFKLQRTFFHMDVRRNAFSQRIVVA